MESSPTSHKRLVTYSDTNVIKETDNFLRLIVDVSGIFDVFVRFKTHHKTGKLL